MSRISFTKIARQDLGEIYEYIAKDNISAADTLQEQLQQRWRGLAHMPGIGSKRDNLKPNLRSVAAGNYVIYYRVVAGGIQIVRVIHSSRDAESAISESEY